MTAHPFDHGDETPRRGGRWLWVILVLGLAFVLERATTAIAAFGRNIPQPAIEWDYVLGLATGIVIGGSILFWPVREADKKHLLRLWGVKCVVVLGLMLPYEWWY